MRWPPHRRSRRSSRRFELDLSEASWETVDGNGLTSAGYRTDVLLSDGGVYDNMGLEPVWGYYRTVLVSDAGGHLGPARIPGRTGETASWRPCRRPYMAVDTRVTEQLASISTRLTDMPDDQQERLINWGFAAADAGLLAHLDAELPVEAWPYPDRPL